MILRNPLPNENHSFRSIFSCLYSLWCAEKVTDLTDFNGPFRLFVKTTYADSCCSLYVKKFELVHHMFSQPLKTFAQALQKLKSNFKDTPLTSSKLETTIIVVCWTRDATLKQTCPNFGISVDTTILTLTFTKNKSKWK